MAILVPLKGILETLYVWAEYQDKKYEKIVFMTCTGLVRIEKQGDSKGANFNFH
jgi:hypothetical protein